MRALALDFETRTLGLHEVPEPAATLQPGEVLLRIHECGVCGTDRELAQFHFGEPPRGERLLVLGHEALAQVSAAGEGVGFARGDWVVPMLRRSCNPACRSCSRGRRDLCVSGGYTERGINRLHGYMCQWAVDRATDLIAVPANLAGVAVLLEPLSVVEKAVERAFQLHPGEPETALVFGAGTIGLLTAMVLRLRGLTVTIASPEPASDVRKQIARSLACHTTSSPAPADIVIEASGAVQAAAASVHLLNPLGVLIFVGATDLHGRFPALEFVLGNRSAAGIVNAGPQHFQHAVSDLSAMDRDLCARMISRLPLDQVKEGGLAFTSAPKTVYALEY